MAADLSALYLLVVQIDGLHPRGDLALVAAIGVDGEGNNHPLALAERRARTPQGFGSCSTSLVSRGLDPTTPGLFIVDRAKVLSKAIRRSFGSAAAPDAGMALRWVAAGMIEANKGFRRSRRTSNCWFCVRSFKLITIA